MATRSVSISKDLVCRFRNDLHQGIGKDDHWLAGERGSLSYFTLVQLGISSDTWKNMKRITGVELEVEGTVPNATAKHWNNGTNGSWKMRPIAEGQSDWPEHTAAENDWTNSNYENRSLSDSYLVSRTGLRSGKNVIDITAMFRYWVPEWLPVVLNGKEVKGRGSKNKGFKIYEYDTSDAHAFEAFSSDENTSGRRPTVTITFDPKNYAPEVALIEPPDGADVVDGFRFEYLFSDNDPDDKPSKVQVEVQRQSTEAVTWKQPETAATDDMKASLMCWSDAPPGRFPTGQVQRWRASVWDKNDEKATSGWRTFKVVSVAALLGPLQLIEPGPSMLSAHFRVPYRHGSARKLMSVRLQLRSGSALPPTSPLWDGGDNAWDTGLLAIQDPERIEATISGVNYQGVIDRAYTGDSLTQGDYSWRIMAIDDLGVATDWVASSFSLSGDWDDPDATTVGDQTGYGKRIVGQRILLRGMRGDRGPGRLKAVIEDAENIGLSIYASAPGELYFTLPATHPQAGECEPYQTHWAFEQYRNGQWKELSAGLLTDFDGTGDDIIIYGTDYLGVLNLDVDRRASATKSKSGPYYKERNITQIIESQLDLAKGITDSPTGFIGHPDYGTDRFQVMSNDIVINSSYRPRLDFIRGLIDSWKGGYGRRPRLKAQRLPSSDPTNDVGPSYAWWLYADTGTDRPALRLEYGSLIQGFRVMAMGDFATRILAAGRTIQGLKLEYKTGSAGLSTAIWGNIARPAVFEDLDDQNDLARRAQQMAVEASRVGKRIALGLRVHSLGLLDGWDILDAVPIRIKRGLIDTDRYAPDANNLSWWVIWGTEYRVFPDGHDELTLVVRPREDLGIPNPDLIPSIPFDHTDEWTVGADAPSPVNVRTTTFYLDQSSGTVYIWDETSNQYQPEGSMAPGGEEPVYAGEWNWTTSTADAAASGRVGIDAATWEAATFLHLNEQKRDGTDVSPYFVAVKPGDFYHVRVQDDASVYARYEVTALGEDMGTYWRWPVNHIESYGTPPGNNEDMVVTALTSSVITPGVPSTLTTTPGFKLVGLSWPSEALADLDVYQVRYAPDDGTGEGPGPDPQWTIFDTKSTSVVIQGLDAGDPHPTDPATGAELPPIPPTTYWFQVRSIDTAGQTLMSAADPRPVDAKAYPDAGWCVKEDETPNLVGAADIAVNSIVANFLDAGTISAQQIVSGTLSVGKPGTAASIEMFDADGTLIGRWDRDGLLLIRGVKAMWLTPVGTEADPREPGIFITNDWAGSIAGATWTSVLTTDGGGINAGAIAQGVSPGGHNAIPNAGFELYPFPTVAATVRIWPTNTPWSASDVTNDVNVNKAGASLTLTTATY